MKLIMGVGLIIASAYLGYTLGMDAASWTLGGVTSMIAVYVVIGNG